MNTARLAVLSALVLGAPGSLQAQSGSYTILDLGTFGTNPAANSNATGLNELGHVVGLAEDDSLGNHAFLYRDGQMIDLGSLLPGAFANAKGVNDLDQVVGQAAAPAPGGNPGFTGRPFLWTEGVGMVDPEPNDPTYGSWCWGINNSGQLAMSLDEAYFWDPVDGLTQIELPGAPTGFASTAWEINNSGEVCGWVRDGSVWLHSYRYDSATDTIEDLHDPVEYSDTAGYGINDNGDIAGWGTRHDNWKPPLVWAADGRTIVLPIGDMGPFHSMGQAEHLNNKGTVVGLDISGLPEEPIGWVAYDVLDLASPFKLDLRTVLSADDQLHWTRMHPFEVNEAGQICGTGVVDGKTRAFLMTPVDNWAGLGGGLPGSAGTPQLDGAGTLIGGTLARLTLSDAKPLSTAWFVLGLSVLNAPFKQGVMVPNPDLIAALATDAAGEVELPLVWPLGIPADTNVWFQYWVSDAAAPAGFASSNGLVGSTP
jgi:probable HAF family extracellular repeat protein